MFLNLKEKINLKYTQPDSNIKSETDSVVSSNEIRLPDDAVILYKDAGAILYQSNEESDIMTASENNYGNAWINKDGGSGSFKVYNTYTGRVGVTWKVEASYNSDYAQIYMMNPLGLVVLATRSVHPSDGDVHLVLTNGVVGNYTVHYIPVKNTSGMRVMCWTYSA